MMKVGSRAMPSPLSAAAHSTSPLFAESCDWIGTVTASPPFESCQRCIETEWP